jgi:hypothetical protein
LLPQQTSPFITQRLLEHQSKQGKIEQGSPHTIRLILMLLLLKGEENRGKEEEEEEEEEEES